MIASPSDVIREREIIRNVIADWNSVNSQREKVVLQPTGWDTHSSPAMGDRPQAIINKQILENCDLLVAVFWTRIGSPTGEEISGTVEEIKKHVDKGKPTMIYFSLAPVRPDSVEPEQYEALKEFKSWCESKGLIETYDSTDEFRSKFHKQLSLTVIREFTEDSSVEDDSEGSSGTGLETVNLEESEYREEKEFSEQLTDNQQKLLIEASNDPGGIVIKLHTLGGVRFLTNRQEFGELRNPRSRAEWEEVLKKLCALGLLEERGYKGEMFEITHLGYKVADYLKSEISENT